MGPHLLSGEVKDCCYEILLFTVKDLNININTESFNFIGIHTEKGNNKDESMYEGNWDS